MTSKKTQRKKTKHGWVIGARYYLQTVTHYFVGTLVAINVHELVLSDVAWVADSGRHSEFVAGASPTEMEAEGPDVEVIIGRGALVASRITKQAARTI